MRINVHKLFLLLCALSLCLESISYPGVKKGVRRRTVTGTYKSVLNTMDVLELPDHKVRISFGGFWPNDHTRVDTRNVGSFDEIVPLAGRTATVKLKYSDDDDECVITIEFKPNRAIVVQEGASNRCGFGFNVEADGTYVKVSSKPPYLPPLENQNKQF